MNRTHNTLRNRRNGATLVIACATFALGAATLWAKPQTPSSASIEFSPESVEFFEKKIRPLLAENCMACHGAKQQSGKLRLDSRANALKGGERGAVVLPGDPEKSLLIQAVRYGIKDLQMPPKGKLSEEQTNLLVEWVRQGAPWAKETAPPSTPNSAAPKPFPLKERAQHWSFRPLKRTAPPTVKNKAWGKSPIDAFLLAKLEEKAIPPASPADKLTLLRRVTFDLIGLPPTPEEIRAYLADNTPNAYEKAVERLLASPHYGERWGRHWLDLVRYAETDGHEFDFEKPGAYEYRDYVVRAFNADVPYNQFVMEHIAGDMLPNPRLNPTEKFNESVLGTGFYWLGEGKHSPVDLREDQAERTDNQVDVVGKTFLALTLGCARCHDHKFDPLPTKDYYAFAGILMSSRYHLQPRVTAKQKETLQTLQTLRPRYEAALRTQETAARQAVLSQWRETLLSSQNGTRLTTLTPNPLSDQWRKYLAETASVDPNNLFYPWAALAKTKPEEFNAKKAQVAQQIRQNAERAAQLSKQSVLFEDFTQAGYPKWFRTGEAFAASPSPLSLLVAPKAVRVAGGGIADSAALTAKAVGALRSADFRISKPFILFRMAGEHAAARLVIDGFQRIRYPIYGGLNIEANTPEMRWYAMNVAKWMGHRAYIEFVDFGEGRIAADAVRFADSPEGPNAPNSLLLAALESRETNSLKRLAEQYRLLLSQSLNLWEQGGLAQDKDAAARADIVDWALRALPVSAGNAPKTTALTNAETTLQTWEKTEASLQFGGLMQVSMEGTGEDEPVHIRGSAKTLGAAAPRRFLEVFNGANQPAPRAGSGRWELAQRLVAPTNPLLARVIVNRIWHHHFGTGIVPTTDDFGLMGQRPSHPELLDWLATEFIQRGWSIKQMHRLILFSNAYRMSSKTVPQWEEKDPQNRLLHRMPVRRLQAEAIRDALLAVSGRLDKTLFGPSVLPYLTNFMEGRGRPAQSGPLDGAGRRSLYIGVRRNFLSPLFLAFDYPVPFNTMGRRSVSNVPAQALILMNNPLVAEEAKVWADRILQSPASDAKARVQEMYLTAFARPPRPQEIETALAFLKSQDAAYKSQNDPRSWRDLCHVLFNVKEFIFIP